MLRRFTAIDYAPAVATVEDTETRRWVNAIPVDDADSMVRLCERERRRGEMLDLVAADQADGSYLGEILLFARPHDGAEVAYVIAPPARGRGIATEAVRLLAEWGFDHLKLQRIELKIHPENVASIRVAEKAGFRREGVLRSAVMVRGHRIDVVSYSRLPTD